MEKDPSAVYPLQPLLLSHDIDQITHTSSLLVQDELELLWNMLQRNKDIFAWTQSDMPRIHPVIASHKFNISTFHPPHAYSKEDSTFSSGQTKNHPDRNWQTIGSWIYQRSQIYGLVGKCGDSSKEREKVTSLCWLQQLEWRLPIG